MKIYANLTSLPPFDVKSLEVEMWVIDLVKRFTV